MSSMPNYFSPYLLKGLAAQDLPLEKDPQLKALQQELVAVDGSLLPALPKMLWALWLDEHTGR